MRNAFVRRLVETARSDERICLIVGDLGYSVIEPFSSEFPDRFLNTGVAEQNMIGVAAGWSMAADKIVFVYSIANFPTLRCLEQIRNDVCHHHANVKIVSVGGGLAYGAAGFTHHGIEDLAIMRTLPGMHVTAPADAAESDAVTRAAIETDGPFFIRLGKNREAAVHSGSVRLSLGDPVPYSAAGDVLLCSAGTIGSEVVEAATLLREQGLSAGVLGFPFVKPMNREVLLGHLQSSPTIVTVEEHCGAGGLGGMIAEVMADHGVRSRLLRIHLPEFVTRLAGQQDLRKHYGLDAVGVATRVQAFCASQIGVMTEMH